MYAVFMDLFGKLFRIDRAVGHKQTYSSGEWSVISDYGIEVDIRLFTRFQHSGNLIGGFILSLFNRTILPYTGRYIIFTGYDCLADRILFTEILLGAFFR